MRQKRARFSRNDEESEINLTPMLDVVFIMLIFFIVTATFIKEPGTDVRRPEAVTSERKPRVAVLVGINASNEIWIDQKQIDPNAVRAQLERLHAENPKGGMVVQVDRDAKNKVLLQVLNAARQAGIQNVSVGTDR